MKVSIVGAAGRVGSNAAFAIQLSNKVRELVLVDVFMADQAEGEALDLRHGASLIGRCKIHAGGYDAVAGSDLIVVTAGLRRRPDESRLDLISRNVEMFKSLMGDLKPHLTQDTLICVVSNPVDILTYIAARESGLPAGRVFGSGTFFDTTRFRSLLAEHFDVDPLQVDALLLGEHGDTMVPVWSRAAVAGVPLSALPGYDPARVEEIFQQTKTAGAEVIRLKGGAGWGIGLTISALVDMVATDARKLIPISTVQRGEVYGIERVATSLPTYLGRRGYGEKVELPLSDSERQALEHSTRTLRETLDKVGA